MPKRNFQREPLWKKKKEVCLVCLHRTVVYAGILTIYMKQRLETVIIWGLVIGQQRAGRTKAKHLSLVNSTRAEPKQSTRQERFRRPPPYTPAVHPRAPKHQTARTATRARCAPMSDRPPRPLAGRRSDAAAGLLPGALSVAAAPGGTAAAGVAASSRASRPHQTPTAPVAPAPTPPVPPLQTVPPTAQRPLVQILPRPGPDGCGLPASPAAGRGRSDARRSSTSRNDAPDSSGGQGRAPAAGHPEQPGRVETGKRSYTIFNQQCAMCNLPEARSDKRFKLCQDDRSCGRWVHKSRDRACHKVFNISAPLEERCCKHHSGLKDACGCNR